MNRPCFMCVHCIQNPSSLAVFSLWDEDLSTHVLLRLVAEVACRRLFLYHVKVGCSGKKISLLIDFSYSLHPGGI